LIFALRITNDHLLIAPFREPTRIFGRTSDRQTSMAGMPPRFFLSDDCIRHGLLLYYRVNFRNRRNKTDSATISGYIFDFAPMLALFDTPPIIHITFVEH
jgi:hypothetical protein